MGHGRTCATAAVHSAQSHVLTRATSPLPPRLQNLFLQETTMASARPSVYIIGVGMSKFSKPAEGNDEYAVRPSLRTYAPQRAVPRPTRRALRRKMEI